MRCEITLILLYDLIANIFYTKYYNQQISEIPPQIYAQVFPFAVPNISWGKLHLSRGKYSVEIILEFFKSVRVLKLNYFV